MLACSELAAEEGRGVLRQLGCLCCKAKPEQMADSYHQDIFVENLVWEEAVCSPRHANTGHGTLTNLKDITRTHGACWSLAVYAIVGSLVGAFLDRSCTGGKKEADNLHSLFRLNLI